MCKAYTLFCCLQNPCAVGRTLAYANAIQTAYIKYAYAHIKNFLHTSCVFVYNAFTACAVLLSVKQMYNKHKKAKRAKLKARKQFVARMQRALNNTHINVLQLNNAQLAALFCPNTQLANARFLRYNALQNCVYYSATLLRNCNNVACNTQLKIVVYIDDVLCAHSV